MTQTALGTFAGIGPTGNGTGQGFVLHSAMMVDADNEEVLGIAGQTLHLHKQEKMAARKESGSQRMNRPRESEVWGTVIADNGKPAKSPQAKLADPSSFNDKTSLILSVSTRHRI